MTTHKSFKRLVRTRMEKTGESYTAARAVLLTAEPAAGTGAADVPLATSDASIRERTGRGWEEWFDVLDGWGEMSHRDRAKRLAAELEIHPLAWNAQAIASSYERVRGLRVPGQHEDGFSATASRTVGVPVQRLYDAFGEPRLSERTATRPRSARYDFDGGPSRVNVTFVAKGEGASTIALEHRRLASSEEAEAMKAFWRSHLTGLKAELEGQERTTSSPTATRPGATIEP